LGHLRSQERRQTHFRTKGHFQEGALFLFLTKKICWLKLN
jgi:hypothetical protein